MVRYRGMPACINYFLPGVVFQGSSLVLRLLLCGHLLVLLSRLLRLLRCCTKILLKIRFANFYCGGTYPVINCKILWYSYRLINQTHILFCVVKYLLNLHTYCVIYFGLMVLPSDLLACSGCLVSGWVCFLGSGIPAVQN